LKQQLPYQQRPSTHIELTIKILRSETFNFDEISVSIIDQVSMCVTKFNAERIWGAGTIASNAFIEVVMIAFF